MQHIDLEPHEYTERGKKEPILHPHWKSGVLAIVFIFLFAMFVGRPLSQWWMSL
jgi:hypothetical protein